MLAALLGSLRTGVRLGIGWEQEHSICSPEPPWDPPYWVAEPAPMEMHKHCPSAAQGAYSHCRSPSRLLFWQQLQQAEGCLAPSLIPPAAPASLPSGSALGSAQEAAVVLFVPVLAQATAGSMAASPHRGLALAAALSSAQDVPLGRGDNAGASPASQASSCCLCPLPRLLPGHTRAHQTSHPAMLCSSPGPVGGGMDAQGGGRNPPGTRMWVSWGRLGFPFPSQTRSSQ